MPLLVLNVTYPLVPADHRLLRRQSARCWCWRGQPGIHRERTSLLACCAGRPADAGARQGPAARPAGEYTVEVIARACRRSAATCPMRDLGAGAQLAAARAARRADVAKALGALAGAAARLLHRLPGRPVFSPAQARAAQVGPVHVRPTSAATLATFEPFTPATRSWATACGLASRAGVSR